MLIMIDNLVLIQALMSEEVMMFVLTLLVEHNKCC